MSRIATWLLLLLLLALFAGVVFYALRARVEAGKEMPPYSVYSEDRNGLADAARLLRQLRYEPVALTRPIQQLRSDDTTPRLLIIVEPEVKHGMSGEAADLSRNDVKGLLRWVEQGNTLLLVGRHPTSLHRDLDVFIRSDALAAEDETPREVVLAGAGGYTEDIDRMAVEGIDSLQGAGLPLWSLNNQPGALLLRRGKGRIIVVADPSLLTRRGLRRHDNVMFLVNVVDLHARDGRVYFDEYHHGLRSGGGFWGYLQYHEQQWMLVPVLAAVIVAGWALMVRLGPPVPIAPEVRDDAVDYASALARIYQQAGVRHLLAKVLAREFMTALTRHLRLRRNALPAEVLAAWRQRDPGQAPRVQNLLRGVAELRQGDLSERRLLNWARAFDQFRKSEVLGGS
ncbi:MAG: DUF4350 domain-containing protein [Gemmataceae bacterium]|nr:DUF4350 domain-containing protein [Gemmataceae bacterium]